MSIMKADRKITHDQIAAGFGPVLAKRLGINLKPVDGLTCQCDPRGDCTCRLATPTPTLATITRDAQRSSDPRLIVAVMALRHLNDRLSRLELLRAGNPQAAQDPQQIVAAAAQKAAMHQAQRYAERVDEMIEDSHQKEAKELDPRPPDIKAISLAMNHKALTWNLIVMAHRSIHLPAMGGKKPLNFLWDDPASRMMGSSSHLPKPKRCLRPMNVSKPPTARLSSMKPRSIGISVPATAH